MNEKKISSVEEKEEGLKIKAMKKRRKKQRLSRPNKIVQHEDP